MLRSSIGAAALLVLGVVACGGGAGGPGTAHPTSGGIASLPAYPDPKEQQKAPAPAPEAPKDPKQICAGATDVKVAESSPAPSAWPGALALAAKSGDFAPYARSSANAKDSTMADLDALARRQAWEELLQHASDVPASQRGPAWDKLVERAAVGYMQTLSTDTAAFEGVFTSQALLSRYPHLLASQDFMSKRGDAGKAAAEICLRESYRGQHCIDMMRDFVKTSGTSPEVGFAFGKITRKNQNHYVAVPFFKWALDQKTAAKGDVHAMCSDEDLKLATISGLGLPPDYENAVSARQIAANACWDGLRADVRKELVASPTGYYRDNACAVLKAKGDL